MTVYCETDGYGGCFRAKKNDSERLLNELREPYTTGNVDQKRYPPGRIWLA